MWRFWLLVVCLIILAGCGYRFAPGGEHIDRKINKVFVDNFKNETSEANIEEEIRGAFIQRLIKGGRFQLADKREQAQGLLGGTLKTITSASISVGAGEQAREERISLSVDVVFSRQDTGRIIWETKNLTGQVDYPLGGNISITQANKNKALLQLLQDLAERAYGLMMSGF